MTTARAALILIVLSLACAGLLALFSRVPESVRRAETPPDATDPSLGARFTPEQVARHGAYRRASYISIVLDLLLTIVILIVLMRGPAASIVQRLPGPWPLQAALLGIALTIVLTLLLLPLSYVRGFAVERAWGLSTQDLAGWLSDKLRGLAVGGVTGAVGAVAFFGVVRAAPRTWWLWGWAVFTALTAIFAFVWPVLIAPLFNTFTPLEDESLTARVKTLAEEAGIPVQQVLVADASRRTTAENAYVAGLGATRRLVLYDTLLRSQDDDQVAFVVAHELGHRVEGHVARQVALSSAGLLVSFGLLYLLMESTNLASWAGASVVSDLRVLPLLVLLATVAGLAALPVQSGVSRAFERRADAIALELTGQPEAAVKAFRRLAFANLADLDPPRPLVWLLYSHPPIPERIRTALAESGRAP